MIATCYNYKSHTIYTDGRLYKAAEHHANLMAIWERKQ